MKHLKKISLVAASMLLAMMSVFTMPISVHADGVSIPVRQTLTIENAESQTYSTTFHYQLSATHPDNPMPPGAVGDTYNFSLDGNNASMSLTIPTADLSPGQNFHYHLKEMPVNPQDCYTYDSRIYDVEIAVAMNPATSQQEVVTNVRLNGVKVSEALFANSFDGSLLPPPTPTPEPTGSPTPEPSPVIVDPPVRKVVVGTPAQDAVFHFTMTGQEGAPMPAGAQGNVKTASVTGAGEVEFGQFPIYHPGIYRYTLAEVDDELEDYAYDGTVYTLTFVIEENESGDLYVAQRIVEDQSGNIRNTAVFSNEYQGSPAPSPGTVDNEPNKNVPKTGDMGPNVFPELGAGLFCLES